LLVAAGFLFVGLGAAGIFLPLLPTTPFLLLAAACFARSSERFYKWLLHNRWFGGYIRDYREGRGIPVGVKIVTVALLWLVIILSAAFAVSSLVVRIILAVIAVGVTAHILSIRTKRRDDGEASDAE
jgi:uncharacterized membrane protein YbaN (DUF454 family)